MYDLTSNEWKYKILWKQRKKCLLWLKMIACWINIMKFGTRLKKTLNTKFQSMPVYDEKYIKAEVK